MGLSIYLIIIALFIWGIHLSNKHNVNAIWIILSIILILFQLPSIINNVNLTTMGYSSSASYYIGYIIGYFIYSILGLLLIYIPLIVRIIKEKKS